MAEQQYGSHNIGGGTLLFLSGALIGIGVGLLFAPQAGKDTRQMLMSRANELRDRATDMATRVRRQAEERTGT